MAVIFKKISRNGAKFCICILLHIYPPKRESDQCAIRARLGVTSHLSTTPRWRNSAKCFSQTAQQANLPACSPNCSFNAERQEGKL